MKAISETIVQAALVDQPDHVSVTEIQWDAYDITGTKVEKTDIGKVIGILGRTAGALRTILNAVSAKERKHTLLEVVE